MITQQEVAKLTLHDQLELMETLWGEISRTETEVEVPSWHRSLLEDREAAVESGSATFIPWEIAKQQIDDICR